MSDGVPNPEQSRQRFAERLGEAGVRVQRFIDVKDGEKGTRTPGHQEPENWLEPDDEGLSGNYGIHPGFGLLEIDKDDYDDEHETEALDSLNDTLAVKSPHTDPEDPGHEYYITEDAEAVTEVLEDVAGTVNPDLSWGEIKYEGKYVVGPGSQLDGCTKEWCDECAESDKGHYRIANDHPIAEITAEELEDVLREDPDIGTPSGNRTATEVFGLVPDEEPDGQEEAQEVQEYEEKLSKEDVEEALGHVDPNVNYPEWSGIGFALEDFFDDSETAEGVFKRWSQGELHDGEYNDRTPALWDNDATGYAEDITSGSKSRGEKRTVATIIHHAEEGGWDNPASNSPPEPEAFEDDSEDVEQTINELWEYVRDCYRPDDDWGGDRRKGRLYAAKTLEKTGAYMHTLESEQLWVYEEATGTFSPWGEQSIDRTLESRLGKFYSNSEKNEIVNRIKARNQTHREELNGGLHPSPLLSVGNGVVDLETGELHDHDPDHKFTRGLEWDYDAKRADKDAVLEFLDDVTKREEDRDTILDHLAHGLMPGHPYRAFLMLYGPGANGKTQIEQLFRGFVGPENAASVDLSEITDGEFATGALPGKFINFGDENSVGEIYDASDLKSLSGGGTMRANEKHEKQYDFENEAAMFFAANEPPRFAEDKDAIADRLYPIEMPFQFKSASEYEDDNPMHKRKVPGIAQDLLADESAMRGLLQLAVEHAQGLIETHGEYSMPEGPNERRLRYEGASDPIKRFLYECLVEGSRSDVIGKTDAYTVYSEMCDMHDERMAGEDTFKEEVTKQTIIDLEKFRTRKITPGEDKDTAWRYANFSDDAKLYMPGRLQERYFGEADDVDETEDADVDDDAESAELSDEGGTSGEDAVFNATPIAKAAESLTGYTTITAEIAAVTDMPGDNNGVKAVAKDASGAIDIVAWDDPFSSRLRAVEGEHVAIKYAEIGEYEDTRQLVPTEGLTEIETVQAGVGHTEGEPTTDGQAELAKTVGDGGVSAVPDDAIGSSPNAQRLHEILEGRSTTAPVPKGELIQKATNRFGMDLEQAADALETAVEKKGIIIETDDGYHPV